MRTAILVVALISAGCATQQGQRVHLTGALVPVPVKPGGDCTSLTRYVRAVAILRDINVKFEDINKMLKSPPDLPTEAIQRDVYYSGEFGPGVSADAMDKKCLLNGYTNTMRQYIIQQAVYDHMDRRYTK